MNSKRRIINSLKSQLFNAWGAWSDSTNSPYDIILMLATVRSGSTLLTHILTTNPEIFGMGESKIGFCSHSDYRLLTGKNLYFHRRNDMPRTGKERFILDKLVHNYLLDPKDSELLNHPRVRIIFLLRDPNPTLLSFMRAIDIEETDALDHYLSRMDCLSQYAQALAPEKTSVLITYEQLLEDSAPVFTLMENYLELKQPLSEKYEVTSTTGVFSLGDKSENIKKGHIVAPNKTSADQLSPTTRAAAQEAYDKCFSILQTHCLTI